MKRYLEYIKENLKTLEDQLLFTVSDSDNYNINDIKYLIDEGVDINVKNNQGFTALSLSAMHGSIDIVKLLLKHPNIDVNVSNNSEKWNALLEASYNGYYDIVYLLIKHPKIDLNAMNTLGEDFIMFMTDEEIEGKLQTYKLQKTVIDNNINNIKVFIKHDIVNPRIKAENPELFKATDWGLIL